MNDLSKPATWVIALIGRRRTGKNSVGTYLMNRHDFLPIALTTPLYDALANLVVDPECLDDDAKDRLPAEGTQSARQLLQGLGDWARGNLGQDILRRHAEMLIRHASRNGVARDFVITDVRTADEILWVWGKGGYVWRVQKPAAPVAVDEHHTESIEHALTQAGERWRLMHPELAHRHTMGADWILSNGGTLEQLHEQVDQALAALGAREFEAP